MYNVWLKGSRNCICYQNGESTRTTEDTNNLVKPRQACLTMQKSKHLYVQMLECKHMHKHKPTFLNFGCNYTAQA